MIKVVWPKSIFPSEFCHRFPFCVQFFFVNIFVQHNITYSTISCSFYFVVISQWQYFTATTCNLISIFFAFYRFFFVLCCHFSSFYISIVTVVYPICIHSLTHTYSLSLSLFHSFYYILRPSRCMFLLKFYTLFAFVNCIPILCLEFSVFVSDSHLL